MADRRAVSIGHLAHAQSLSFSSLLQRRDSFPAAEVPKVELLMLRIFCRARFLFFLSFLALPPSFCLRLRYAYLAPSAHFFCSVAVFVCFVQIVIVRRIFFVPNESRDLAWARKQFGREGGFECYAHDVALPNTRLRRPCTHAALEFFFLSVFCTDFSRLSPSVPLPHHVLRLRERQQARRGYSG